MQFAKQSFRFLVHAASRRSLVRAKQLFQTIACLQCIQKSVDNFLFDVGTVVHQFDIFVEIMEQTFGCAQIRARTSIVWHVRQESVIQIGFEYGISVNVVHV